MSRRWRLPRGTDGSPINLVGVAMLCLLLASLLCAGWLVRGMALQPRPTTIALDPAASPKPAPSEGTFKDAIDDQLAQIDGRSLFFIPPPPSDKPDAKNQGPKPTVYGGPSLLAMVNGTAWFSDGDRVSESKPEGKGLKLVRLNAPWGARVEWQGGEFDVELFKRVGIESLRDTLGKPTSATTIAPSATPGAAAAPSLLTPTTKPADAPASDAKAQAGKPEATADPNHTDESEGGEEGDKPASEPAAPASGVSPGQSPGATKPPPAAPPPR